MTPTALPPVDSLVDVRTPAESRDHPGCDVCLHPMSDHDAIGLRFCRATLAGAIPRGCVCRS
jgi:hypothetical protein